MSANQLNRRIVIGRIGKDLEVKKIGTGDKAITLVKFSVVTNEYVGKKDNKPTYEDTWHNVEVWGSKADYLVKNAAKGDVVYLEGRHCEKKWEPKDGSGTKFFNYLQITLHKGEAIVVEKAGSNNNNGNGNGGSQSQGQQKQEETEDIPF